METLKFTQSRKDEKDEIFPFNSSSQQDGHKDWSSCLNLSFLRVDKSYQESVADRD